MRDTGRNQITCGDVQEVMAQKRALTPAESAHVESCRTCLDAWLDAAVTHALETKPEVPIPADFAARVTAQLPAARGASNPEGKKNIRRQESWGLLTAALLIALGMLIAAIADPVSMGTRMGLIFLSLVASEIAAIALWLGVGHAGGSAK